MKLVHELGIIGGLGLFQKPGSGKTHMWFALVGKFGFSTSEADTNEKSLMYVLCCDTVKTDYLKAQK